MEVSTYVARRSIFLPSSPRSLQTPKTNERTKWNWESFKWKKFRESSYRFFCLDVFVILFRILDLIRSLRPISFRSFVFFLARKVRSQTLIHFLRLLRIDADIHRRFFYEFLHDKQFFWSICWVKRTAPLLRMEFIVRNISRQVRWNILFGIVRRQMNAIIEKSGSFYLPLI